MSSFGRSRGSGLAVLVGFGLWAWACSPAAPEVPDSGKDEPAGRGGTAQSTGGATGLPTGGSTASGGTSNAAGGSTASGGTSSATGGSTARGGTGNATGGTATTGGTSGTQVVPDCGLPVGAASDKAVDDLEDRDNTIGNGENDPTPPVRVGYWFTYNEKTDNPSSSCLQSPPPDPSGLLPFPPKAMPGNGSGYGAHTSGTGCTSVWGAGIGVDFNNCNGKTNPYDASAYSGITFWYKSTTPIRALVGTLANLPRAEGGQCDGDCYNHHGKNLPASSTGTTATITWAELDMMTTQIGTPPMEPQSYGTKRAFNPAQLLNLQVQVDQTGGARFDLWLDDLAFL